MQGYKQKPVPITICSIFFITILREVSGITIGGIVGLDIFFLAFVSGASMNPARSLAPALVSSFKQFMDLLVGYIYRHIRSCLNVPKDGYIKKS